MAKPPSYYDLEQIPLKANLKSRENPQRLYAFVVFLCSIFVYISIFYIFNLSPSKFLYNNKFWFFISNTLILIIAADYGAFSSSEGNKNDVYEEYVMHSQARSSFSSFVSQYQDISSSKNIINPRKEESPAEDSPEVKKEVIVVSDQKEKLQENDYKPPQVVTDKTFGNPNESFQEKPVEARTYRRTKSDNKTKRSVLIDESKNSTNYILRRSESEVREEPAAADSCQEENEFSSMSNEELNRRVEEFIQKFNRQIRLQRAGKFHEI